MAKKLLYQALAFVPVVVPTGTADVLFSQSNDLVPHQRVTLYQSIAEPVPIVSAAPTVNVDSWVTPLAQPQARQRRPDSVIAYVPRLPTDVTNGWVAPFVVPTLRTGFPLREQQSLAFVPTVAAPSPGSGDVLFAQASTSVIQQKTLLYQSVFAPVPIVSSETITADKWFRPLAEPVWRKPKPESGPTYVPRLPTDVTNGWLVPLSTPTLRTGFPAKEQQSLAFVPTVAGASPGSGDVLFAQTQTSVIHQKALLYQSVFAPTAIVSTETVTVDKWFAQLSIPPDGGFGSADLSGTFFAVEPSFGWYSALNEPTRRKVTVTPHPTIAFVQIPPTPETITLDKWYRPLSEPSRRKYVLQVQQPAFVTFKTPEYFYPPLAEPTRAKRSVQQQELAFVSVVAQAEVITVDKWFQPLSSPTPRKGLSTSEQQSLALGPFPITASLNSWWSPLAEPIRRQTRIDTQPTLAPTEIITVDKWYRQLAEPLRRSAKNDAPQPAFVGVVSTEIVTVDKWYCDFDVPTRRISYKATLAPYYFASNYLVPAPYVDPPMASWSYSWSMPVRVRTSIMTAAQASGVIPVIPQPNPPPAPGVYTVSGLYVTDQFTDNTVVYNYGGGVSHRTN